MIFYPAIDLKDGNCVRLLRGEMDQATVFSGDPAGQARKFADAGCAWLHVVDLNGAVAGVPVNTPAVQAILQAVEIPVQLGGGIRGMESVDFWLEKGVARVILGTAALKDPALVRAAAARHPGRIAVGIDARGGRVAVEGWTKTSDMEAVALALKFDDAGVDAIIHTDINRDGLMAGPNVDATVALARAIKTPVIASGGVASMDDLTALKNAGGDILDGAISGRAIYDGRIDPASAQELLASGEGPALC